jgi:hypothetical protein
MCRGHRLYLDLVKNLSCHVSQHDMPNMPRNLDMMRHEAQEAGTAQPKSQLYSQEVEPETTRCYSDALMTRLQTLSLHYSWFDILIRHR